MTITWLDLTLFTGAVYGIAWLLTKSKLFRRVRRVASRIPFLGDLLQCVVCTATWVGFAIMPMLGRTTLFSPGFRVRTLPDVVFLSGWVIATSWAIGRLLGDARTEPDEEQP